MSKKKVQFAVKEILKVPGKLGKTIIIPRGIIIVVGGMEENDFPQVGKQIDFDMEEPKRKIYTKIDKIEGNTVYIKQI
ncbi:hypothetical protein EG359_22455 (plasmid) [Chryseobacterium joostei]|uniref:Uncharacterized protein n=1 Tax=Chryseobacterium joostei TaxID=112234 RepID=A0A1N7KFL6_9FLAO|nr:hypothetical protein [Chryseobacterium joostei]AZB02423.1 hypothetical protein EG359_22455 [Chryseobacterium joostei]SIS60381.1 hypothetical protein SAMN05421768_1122 [Chryseobacterium joostei]